MKGKIETTIPQRQYENLKISYEYSSQEDKAICIEEAIQDLIKYNNIVKKRLDETLPKPKKCVSPQDEAMGVIDTSCVNGVSWRQRHKKDKTWWEYYETATTPHHWAKGEKE